MPDRIIGRRDSTSDEWNWGPAQLPGPQRSPGPRRPRRSLILAAIGLVVLCVGVILLLLSTQSSGGESTTERPASSGTSAALGAASTPEESPGTTPATVTPSLSALSGDIRLFAWSRQDARWLDADTLSGGESYKEGDAVPFMLQIANATPSAVYEVEIVYECQTSDGAAFDYLSSVSEAESGAHMTSPGPMRREDASILISDDPSIEFDGSDRRFRVWGGSFEESPTGPFPSDACQSEKRFTLSLLAQGSVVSLIWGGHLALASNWGEGKGAASQQSPIRMEATADETVLRIEVDPGSVAD